jgi:hypothetical protein
MFPCSAVMHTLLGDEGHSHTHTHTQAPAILQPVLAYVTSLYSIAIIFRAVTTNGQCGSLALPFMEIWRLICPTVPAVLLWDVTPCILIDD